MKKVLKVGLYNSQDVGIPATSQLYSEPQFDCKKWVKSHRITTEEALENLFLFLAVKEVFGQFKLIAEVRDLNRKCFVQNSFSPERKVHTYNLDSILHSDDEVLGETERFAAKEKVYLFLEGSKSALDRNQSEQQPNVQHRI